MKFGSLFSGIGGFDLGFERAGLSCEWQVEINSDCNRVLSRHWPNVRRYNDVSTIGNLSGVSVLCGGFPCQDLSVAGKRTGLAGERSGLWFEFLRVIKSNLPRWVVIENVPGLLSSNEGRDFTVILRGLVKCGYCVAWRILDAQYDGVAQRRRRVFIVGSLGDGSCAEILFESEGVSRNPPTRGEAGARVAAPVKASAPNRRNGGSDPIADEFVVAATLDQRGRGPTDAVMMNLQIARPLANSRTTNHYDESQQTYIYHENIDGKVYESVEAPALRDFQKDAPMVFGWNKSESQTMRVDDKTTDALQSSSTSNPAILFDERNITSRVNRSNPQPGDPCHTLHSDAPRLAASFGVRRLTPRECERLQGFPDDWTLYDASGKEISDSARYRMLGNAVCVNVAEWIGKRIITMALKV